MSGEHHEPDLIREALTAGLAGRYRIDLKVGHGGMGVVYRAHDLRHERPVAIKVLLQHISAALGAARFLREIQITARLAHPNVLPLLDSGEVDGYLFFVAPFIEGESLRALALRRGGMPLDEALPILREVAEALDFAHRNNVVHRDIKPDNVFLLDGHAVLGDFGLARAMDAAGGPALTQSGIALGSPGYMSPEQALGSRVLDGRADQYSFGCMVYELLTTQLPFDGPDIATVLKAHARTAPPDIRELKPDLAPGVGKALKRAMAKRPGDRFPTVRDCVDALEAATAPSPPARVSTKMLVFLVVVLVAAAIAVGMVLAG